MLLLLLLLLTLITHRRRIGVAALLLLDTEQLPETRSFLKHRSLSLFVRVVRGDYCEKKLVIFVQMRECEIRYVCCW